MLDFTLLAHAAADAGEHGGGHAGPVAFGILQPAALVGLAMLALIAVMIKVGVPKLVTGMLDKQIAEVREQLDAAKRLRAEAEALRGKYEGRITEAAADAERIKAAAEDEARHILERAETEATALIARRTRSAEDKIAAAERNAIAELRVRAAEASTAAARTLIAQSHDAGADKALVDQAIAGI
jgi:F-type H+-transporting ATPase subunit b